MKILSYKKINSNEYKVILENNLEVNLYDEIIITHELLLKKAISEEELENIVKANKSLKSYYQALKYLSVKMRSKKELINYLHKQGYNDLEIESTLQKLEQQNYLDDIKYIKMYISDQLKLTLNGPLKIKRALLNEDISEEKIDESLSSISDLVWQEKIQKIIDKRKNTNKDSQLLFKQKTSNYLNNLGYRANLYQELLDKVTIFQEENFINTANKIYKRLSHKYQKEALYLNLQQRLYQKGYSKELITKYLEQIKSD